MTGSTHEYTATLVVGGDEYEVDMRRTGRIALDEGSAPHVTADLELALPAEATLELLDPRATPRVRIDVHASVPVVGLQDRSFDLGVRRRPVRRARDSYVGVSLASDEALLEDHKPLADDATPRVHEGSLRDVCNYVIGEAIPGTALAPGSTDADVTAFWEVTNVVVNPTGTVDASNWINGSGAMVPAAVTMSAPLPPIGNRALTWTATVTGESNVIPTLAAYRVTPGRWYTFAVYICTTGTARTGRAAIQWWGETGSVIVGTELGATITSDATAFRVAHVVAQAPAGAQSALPYASIINSGNGQQHFAAMAMFYEGSEVIPPFLGSTAPGNGYTYAWADVANASPSTRTPDVERLPESLIWRAGKSALEFLHPLVQAAGFRLVCDEQRVWTLRDEGFSAPGLLSIREGVNLIDGEDVIDRDSGLWFDAQVTTYEWDDEDGIRRRRIDSYALSTPPSLVNEVTVNAPFMGPGRSQYAVRRAQGRGREVIATTVADWRAAAEQPITILLEGAPPQVGQTSRVEFDISNDRMTTTTRTTEIPFGSIDLLPGTIDSLVGTIDSL